MRIAAVVAVVAMAALCAGVVRGQAAAQPKPLVNSDIVKLVKAGLAADTIVLTIQNKPSSFDTNPDELIRLKEQGVSQGILNAMLNASTPAPAAPVPPAAPSTKKSSKPGEAETDLAETGPYQAAATPGPTSRKGAAAAKIISLADPEDDEPVLLDVDGDQLGSLPAVFEIVPRSLPVIGYL